MAPTDSSVSGRKGVKIRSGMGMTLTVALLSRYGSCLCSEARTALESKGSGQYAKSSDNEDCVGRQLSTRLQIVVGEMLPGRIA